MKNPLIFTPRSRLAYALEFLLTLVMWVFFMYLFLRDVLGVLKKPLVLTAVGESGMLSALTGSLLLYALIALLNGRLWWHGRNTTPTGAGRSVASWLEISATRSWGPVLASVRKCCMACMPHG